MNMQYHHIFGPVVSRRLGISLGVDLVTHKICSLDCVYCECGKTTRLTMEPREYVRFSEVKKELDHYLRHNPDPDYITFSGSGEPTLNSSIGRVIEHIKDKTPRTRVAVLTNSTLLFDPKVRQRLLKADLVVPSLDAVSQKMFARMNRPGSRMDAETVVRGIVDFKREYPGQLWLEIFILPGINDNESELLLLKGAIQKIHPDQVQINTLDRPGTVSDLRPATGTELERVIQILDFPKTEIIARVDENLQACIQREDVKAAIMETVHRRPCTKKDLQQVLGLEKDELDRHIHDLEAQGKIFGQARERGIFFQTIKEK
jgi:wyosine [tRNA(Phe)-imidazoG37] synthetase (radical SAM superfamily)